MDNLLKLSVEMTDESLKKEDIKFQELVKNYENCLNDFESYLKSVENDTQKFKTILVHLMGISFKMNLLIEKYQKKEGE